MGSSLSELRKITNFCRKNGIISFENADFKIAFSDRALKIPRPKLDEVGIPAGLTPNPMLPDLTLWSSTPPMGLE